MCIMCSHETHNLVSEKRENGHYPTTFRYGCSNHLWERSSQSSSSFSFKLSGCSCWIWWTSFISSVVWVWRYVLWRLETFARLYHHLTSILLLSHVSPQMDSTFSWSLKRKKRIQVNNQRFLLISRITFCARRHPRLVPGVWAVRNSLNRLPFNNATAIQREIPSTVLARVVLSGPCTVKMVRKI